MEQWPFTEILDHQAFKAERLVRYVRTAFRRWRIALKRFLTATNSIRNGGANLPVLTRSDLQKFTPALDAIEPPPEMGGRERSSTSGSTGQPVEYAERRSPRQQREACAIGFIFGTALTPTLGWPVFPRIGAIRDWPDGRSGGTWCSYGPAGTKHTLTIFVGADQQLDWLRRVRPRYLTTISSNLHELAEAALATGRSIEIEAVLAAGRC